MVKSLKMDIEKEGILRKYLINEGVNLFLGAGFSFGAYNLENDKLPLGDSLKDLLVSRFELQAFSSMELPQISSIVKKTQKGEFHRFLKELYTVKTFEPYYSYLDLVKINNIFTLNIDNLIEKIYSQTSFTNILNETIHFGFNNNRVNLFKLHGSVTYPNGDLLFTPDELSTLMAKDTSLFGMVAHLIASSPTIFCGTQMADSNVIQLISEKNVSSEIAKEKWILITPEEKNNPLVDYYKIHGFNIIRGYTEDLLNYFFNISQNGLLSFTNNVSKIDKNLQKIIQNFSESYVTHIKQNQHPVRPLVTFFSGDDPVWSDVIEGNLIKLSHYNNCLAKIEVSNSLLLAGGIGSGKSTLLMQLAVDEAIIGEKFYFKTIDANEASHLNSLLELTEKKVFIFLDDLASNLEAYKIFSKNNKIKLIVAERDITFDSIKNHTTFTSSEIIDITTISKIDIQNLCNLAHNTSFRQYSENLSLFELAYFIWEGKKLSTKIREFIEQLASNVANRELYEFFTLMAYVRSCGIAASMDMLLMYYSGQNLSYKDIYDYARRLQSMIDETDHPTVSSEQDYFTLRSKLFSELAIKDIDSEMLAEVLLKFANKVHRSCIVRYDIFKRKAFDADITKRAFSDVEEGKKFYENVINIDDSEFRYQQFALYLFRSNKLDESWKMIEKAYNINSNNMTIRNSHAYILFKNNIRLNRKNESELQLIRETLNLTFETIENCINKDMRKTYHVITYAENGLEYYQKYGENQNFAEDIYYIINKAKENIKEELNSKEFLSNHNRSKLKKLINSLEKIKV